MVIHEAWSELDARRKEAQRCQSPRSLLLHRKQMKKSSLFQSEFWDRLFIRVNPRN